jgi:hypothetical protein
MTQLAQEPLDELPPDVVDQLPDDIVDQLQDGIIDRIPDEVIDRLPESVTDRIPSDLLDAASANPTLTAILIGVGVLAVAIFIWGVVKSAWKAAFFAAVVGGAAWFWYFNT